MIHPIAGKCKHCKADLSAYRAARPAANAPLPALHRAPAAQPNGHAPQPNGHANGHAARPVAHAQPATAAAHDVPVLPPRPTRSQTVEPTASTWRSWPVLVIVLAMIAIVAAVVLMVWPESDAALPRRALQPPPAPERMQTDPDLKQPPARAPAQPAPQPPARSAAPDPWDSPTAPAPAPRDPTAQAAPNPLDSTDANEADDDDLDVLKNPFAPSAPSTGRPLPLNRHGTMVAAMFMHVCRKLVQCNVDNPVMMNVCDQLSHDPTPPPANCPAAARCLRHIDGLSCTSQTGNLTQLGILMTRFQDCADAARC